jgi:TonB family protein
MQGIKCIAAGLLLLASQQGDARSWPDAGGWTVFENEDSCTTTSEFEGKGDTELAVTLYLNGDVMAYMTNTGWSAKSGEAYDLTWLLNGSEYTGKNVGLGKDYDSRKGFGAKFVGAFADDFAKASNLRVYRGDVLVDQLSLSGSAAAVAMVRRCLGHVRAITDAALREKQRLAHIADDPFSGTPSKDDPEPRSPRTPPGVWLSDADYPSRAQREEREGTVGYRLEIGPDGRVTNCIVTSSSGHADLDEATCRLIPKRAKFAGSAVGTYDGKQVWRLPE